MTRRTGLLAAVLFISPLTARAADAFTVRLEIGPVPGISSSTRTISFEPAARRQVRVFDVQDGREHNVRGVSLRSLLAVANAPKAVDAVLITYTDGMQIPVHLADKETVDAVLIALEHGDILDRYTARYPLPGRGLELPCPKVVYGRKVTGYTIWRYPTELATIKLVTWRSYEATLAQPTRRVPDRSGWALYLRHCQPCHGIGGQGAARAPDFLSAMDAYRRVPPHAATDWDEQPSLHEKIKGNVDGNMPLLKHIPNAEISSLWRWLHTIHAGARK
jgi:hypothetical protein